MNRLGALGVGIVLRRLTAVGHAVVPHDADAAKPRTVPQGDRAFEGFGGGVVAPGHEQDDVARCQNGIERIPANETRGIRREAQPPTDADGQG